MDPSNKKFYVSLNLNITDQDFDIQKYRYRYHSKFGAKQAVEEVVSRDSSAKDFSSTPNLLGG